MITWQTAAIGFGVLFGLLLFLVGMRELAKRKLIPDLIRPYLHYVIMGAYKASERMFDEIGRRMYGADKRQIALDLYVKLPDTVTLFGKSINWKNWISEEEFADRVQAQFDQFIAWWDDAEDFVLDYLKPA